ncbi:MAG: hypothetical protein SF002_17725 [Alphaproteobacteria bacterium]|nr:hypothetical protein [Alphaproteobacteria bacterium]
MKSKSVLAWLSVIAVIVGVTPPARAGDELRLRVTYIDRAPYMYRSETGPVGVLFDRIDPVLRAVGVVPSYEPVPPSRILELFRRQEPMHCSVGWFRTPEREAALWFSLPIYRNRPPVLVVNAAVADAVAATGSVAVALTNPDWVVGVVERYSYGVTLDAILAHAPARDIAVADTPALMRRVALGRNHIMIADPEEVAALWGRVGIDAHRVRVIAFADMPEGNTRHLMCDRSIPHHIRDAIDAEIRLLDLGLHHLKAAPLVARPANDG